ncbi:DUF262 domain-containing protein [Thalassospira tepidiphila]|uniref:GmrSD restriction endonucleases N-terminal domain-containing protein n=2 Tax=Thalassospira tepidiphila TaxID=393657 RepID=A0A853KWE6_9PROT|nr:DUF262 domain-containing protein [Thalassospira tepidiphila]NJB75933.1 hypothetical protein [Thalassospira tepidiphila]OAZ08766.1 hypothetical protein TH4_15455 [Thalassospira tepidiphila MCCC 1A03514]
MPLEEEVKAARTEIVSDGYEMSIGEIINLYKDQELIIDPAFQRLFRWDDTRKTRFIETLLLGIPVPPIFVFQDENGVWELIDGLQRLSTVFQFAGVLRKNDGEAIPPLHLNATNFLPSLNGKTWDASNEDPESGIGQALQLEIKRARVRVEILKKESDAQAKFELFQRLNTGGAPLSEQEIRNCVAVMVNREFYDWLIQRSDNNDFKVTTAQTETAIANQAGVELALRFIAFRHSPYDGKLDVHEYLDNAIFQIASDKAFDRARETEVFEKTFALLNSSLGTNSFKRWNGNEFKGKFLMSVYEVIAHGTASNLDAISALPEQEQREFIINKAKSLWDEKTFDNNSGGGVRGTTRLSNLIPFGAEFLKP